MKSYGQVNAYQTAQVSTVNKSKLIILMYDGAIRFINEAVKKINAQDIPGRGMYISKAQKIVHELESALDKSRGGDVALHLQNSYAEINRNLLEANISGETPPLKTALDMLNTLRDAWDQIINGPPAAGKKNPARPPEDPRVALNI